MKIDWLIISKTSDDEPAPEKQTESRLLSEESKTSRQSAVSIKTQINTKDFLKERSRVDFERRMDAVDARRAYIARRKKYIAAAVGVAAILLAALFISTPATQDIRPQETISKPQEQAKVTLVVDDQVIALDPATETIAENIVNNNGQITYAATNRIEVKINKLITPKCMEYSVRLSDGTTVWLNAASELTYPNHFAENERRVSLKGEAYFDVAKDAKRKFIVEAEGMNVNVYGTLFNVNTHKEDIEVVLVEGSVALDHGNSPEVQMEQNQLALYNKKSSVMIVKQVDVMNYIAWRYGEYRFEDERLGRILEDIALWYDIEPEYTDPALKELVFTCYLPKTQNISELLKHIEKTSYVKFELNNKLLIVKQK